MRYSYTLRAFRKHCGWSDVDTFETWEAAQRTAVLLGSAINAWQIWPNFIGEL